jgi:hypothetical protein
MQLTSAIEAMSNETGEFDLTTKYDTGVKDEIGALHGLSTGYLLLSAVPWKAYGKRSRHWAPRSAR